MKHLSTRSTFFRSLPEEITHQEWRDLEIVKYDEYGGIVKNSPIPPSFFREIVAIGGDKKYTPIRDHGSIHMRQKEPNTKSLYVLYFEPQNEPYPYYLIRFSTNDTIPEPIQRERGLIKYYVADTFDQVKNFCKANL